MTCREPNMAIHKRKKKKLRQGKKCVCVCVAVCEFIRLKHIYV